MAEHPILLFECLTFRESMGLRGQIIYLMEEHFGQTLGKQNILNIWKVGGNAYWIDRAFAKHLVLIYYWIMWFIRLFPVSAYDLNERVEWHAAHTYEEYLTRYPNDEDIIRIRDDEIKHAQELSQAMEMIK